MYKCYPIIRNSLHEAEFIAYFHQVHSEMSISFHVRREGEKKIRKIKSQRINNPKTTNCNVVHGVWIMKSIYCFYYFLINEEFPWHQLTSYVLWTSQYVLFKNDVAYKCWCHHIYIIKTKLKPKSYNWSLRIISNFNNRGSSIGCRNWHQKLWRK